MTDLKSARDNLFDNASKNFNIEMVAIDPESNGLAVFTTDYSNENKNRIINYVQMYTNEMYATNKSTKMDVALYNNRGVNATTIENEDDVQGDIESRATYTVSSGVYLSHQPSSNYESSVGWRVQVDGVAGFTTCGHNWENGETAYYKGNNMGYVQNHFNASDNTDVSFIPSNAAFYGMRGDGTKIDVAGPPIKGAKIIMDGARHYQEGKGRVEATITCIEGVVRIVDKLDRDITITDVLVFDKQPIPGDSGCAIIQVADGKKSLVGFNTCQYKGPNDPEDVWSYGAAVTWGSVRDALGGRSVVKPMN